MEAFIILSSKKPCIVAISFGRLATQQGRE